MGAILGSLVVQPNVERPSRQRMFKGGSVPNGPQGPGFTLWRSKGRTTFPNHTLHGEKTEPSNMRWVRKGLRGGHGDPFIYNDGCGAGNAGDALTLIMATLMLMLLTMAMEAMVMVAMAMVVMVMVGVTEEQNRPIAA